VSGQRRISLIIRNDQDDIGLAGGGRFIGCPELCGAAEHQQQDQYAKFH
jgi:hypothetical protein